MSEAEHDHDDENHHGHGDHSSIKASAHATFHCLIGCYIGDAIGVSLGVGFALGTVMTIVLGVTFAYIAGFALALIPIMRQMDMSLVQAMKVVWLGEAISIAAMESAMIGMDYWIGGIQAASLSEPIFWIGLAAAAPAGFFAAWPVNHWLLIKQIKEHH